jgi:hypothetical protein
VILSSSLSPNCQYRLATPADDLQWLEEVLDAVALKRGGAALLENLSRGAKRIDALTLATVENEVWLFCLNGQAVGAALLRADILSLIYVVPTSRRQHIASGFVHALSEAKVEVRDGLALPGDRATKSLYESLGWKARLVTMRR